MLGANKTLMVAFGLAFKLALMLTSYLRDFPAKALNASVSPERHNQVFPSKYKCCCMNYKLDALNSWMVSIDSYFITRSSSSIPSLASGKAFVTIFG